MTEQMGYASRMTVGGNAVEFITHDIKETRELVEDDGIRGVRSRVLERVALGNIKVGGSITFEPTPAEMAILLPLVVSSSTSATVLTDAMADVTVVIDTVTKLYTYIGRFTAMHLTGEPGKKIKLKLDFVGKTLVVASGGSLAGIPDITVRPYMMADMGSGITIGGTVYSVDKFEMTLDNHIEPTFMQGQTATDLEPTDRTVSLGIQTRYNTAEDALLVLAQTGPVIASPLTASVAFTNGVKSMTFTFGALVAKSETVTHPGKKGKLRLPLNYNCYKVGTTLETVPVLV